MREVRPHLVEGANVMVPLLAVAANLMQQVYRNVSKTIQFGNVHTVVSYRSCSGGSLTAASCGF
jgi:hypothetical protein